MYGFIVTLIGVGGLSMVRGVDMNHGYLKKQSIKKRHQCFGAFSSYEKLY